MKNLRVLRRGSRLLESLGDSILSNLKDSRILCAVNPNNDDFYLSLGNKIHKIPSNYEEDLTSFDFDDNLEIIYLEYSSVTQQLYAACKTGCILQLSVDSLESKWEEAVQLQVDLQCMKLSPDHEILVVVTASGTVITMVSMFQVMSEVNLHSSQFGEKQFITVGWGKKETQFHGSQGKKAALAKPDEVNKNEVDNGVPVITWREDGSLFAVSFLNQEHKARQFKVFNREGILQYTSELLNGIEQTLSWKPSGHLLATTQTLPNKHVVALFEKNGLKHREFTLPFAPKEIVVKDLFWSPDSDILTIWCGLPNDSGSMLQLWSENNYHWYLKQTIKFTAENPLIYATWSLESKLKKLILLVAGELLTCTYTWTVNHSHGKSQNDNVTVGVIDGKKCLATHFKEGIVPPPMAHEYLETSQSINSVVFAPEDTSGNSNAFFCVTADNELSFYKSISNGSTIESKSMGTVRIKSNDAKIGCKSSVYALQHFLWLKENVVLCSTSVNYQSILCVLNVNGLSEDRDNFQIAVEQTHIVDGLIEHIILSPEPNEAYVIVDNCVLKYASDTELYPTDISLPNHSYKVEVVQIAGKHKILSLSHRNTFSIDGNQIANNITSFFVHSQFLLLTTIQHALICVPLSEKGLRQLVEQDLTMKPWENNYTENASLYLNVRRVERGSFLIVTIPGDSKTILQMPRGNLECIQPRPLSLYAIGDYLSRCEYALAFDLMRKQRINLNLIFDHDPDKFLKNAERFVDEVSKPNQLSLFLLELQDNDVTTTVYTNYYWKDQSKVPFTASDSKTKVVCDLLRSIMEKKNDDGRLIEPILLSLVKSQRKQNFEMALLRIKTIKEMRDSGEMVKYITPEEALKYLLYLVDVNVLFDTALGMYDFDLTMFIGAQSQKDPKEYVPFLNELKKLDENYMKYSIDMHLKRYDTALEHIVKERTRFNECMNLIQNQELYTKALKLFAKESSEYKTIARAYGEFLWKKSKYVEAGLMFSKGEDFSKAIAAYKVSGNWQDVIIMSTRMELNQAEKELLYKSLATRLASDKRYQDAAYILINYLKNIEKAIAYLCDGKHWVDAVRLAHEFQRADLIDSVMKPAVFEQAECTLKQIQDNQDDFKKYTSRLMIVRQNLLLRIANSSREAAYDNELPNRGISDILSDDASSVASSSLSTESRSSGSSGRSYRSSKNRRKQERKLLSLKEGGVFEDLGLMQALHQLITKVYKEKEDVGSLIQMLVYFDGEEHAEKVQNSMDDFLRVIEKNKRIIWEKSAPSSLAEMEKLNISSAAQMQELEASRKLVEPYIVLPPEASATQWKLEIF